VFAVHSLLADNLVEQTFITFGIGGICAASLISFSYCLPACLPPQPTFSQLRYHCPTASYSMVG